MRGHPSPSSLMSVNPPPAQQLVIIKELRRPPHSCTEVQHYSRISAIRGNAGGGERCSPGTMYRGSKHVFPFLASCSRSSCTYPLFTGYTPTRTSLRVLGSGPVQEKPLTSRTLWALTKLEIPADHMALTLCSTGGERRTLIECNLCCVLVPAQYVSDANCSGVHVHCRAA